MPKDAPFPGVKFDLIYAFSVFTHLAEKTSKVVLSACRRSLKDDGLLALTIRPAAYWDVHNPHNPGNQPFDLTGMKADHAVRGLPLRLTFCLR
jgi:SAM-dependent methyltransferase